MSNAVTLSEQQQAVIDWAVNGKGSLNLEARAGCGKTFTLLQLVKHMKGQGFIGAYNKAIADEIKGKLAKAGIDWKVCEAGTMHSMGLRAWKKMAPGVERNINKDKVAVIIGNLILAADQEGNFEEAEFLKAAQGVTVKTVSFGKHRGLGALAPFESDEQWFSIIEHFGVEDDFPEDFDVARFVALCKKVYRISLNTCKETIDFDDMLLAPLVFKARFWQLDYVFVDEAQDTNPVRRALALKMLKPTGRLVAVGDPFQAIYGFTGADADSMKQLAHQLGSTTLPLTKTYRCAKSIIRHANKWVSDIEAHENNPEGIVRTISDFANDKPWFLTEDLQPTDAILCRNTKPLIQIAYGLIRAGKACRVEGREIGGNLLKLATRWKAIKSLRVLSEKVEDHKAKQIQKWLAKGREDRAQNVEDECETLQAMIEGTISRCGAQATVTDLANEIRSMFDDNVTGVTTLCTVHKSKGREWNRVFLFGRNKFMPSKYARQKWQMEQERNLIYVAITRAINELCEIYVETEK